MSHEAYFEQSRQALDSFMECLRCKKCNNVPKKPMRFINCAHFFCKNCIPKNVSTCGFCGVPVKPNDCQPDFMVESLIKSSIDLYNLINKEKYNNKEDETTNSKTTSTKSNEPKNTKTRMNRKKSTESIKPIDNKTNKLDECEIKSVSSIAKSSKLSSSKESLFTEPEDTLVLSKKMLQNLNKRNYKGEVPLHSACAKGKINLVRALLEAGADPNVKDNAKLTPLIEAASYGFYEICNLLLQSGAQPNTPGANNQTALHAAVQRNRVKEAELLIKFGANSRAKDDHGKNPEDYCFSEEMREVLQNSADKSDEFSLANMSLNTTIINSALGCDHFVVLPLQLDRNDVELLRKVAAKHKFNIVTSFRNEVTHVIVKTNNVGSVELSYNICMALLTGTWILMFQWINFLENEEDYDVDSTIFEVNAIEHSVDTPRRARENAQNQRPRLFNNCTFYFALNNKSSYVVGNMELTKDNFINLATLGEGKILKRMPRPEDITDNEIVPFHVSEDANHPLYKCSHYIIYEPGKDEPKMKYNMTNIKTLPLLWFVESIEKFTLMDPTNYGF